MAKRCDVCDIDLIDDYSYHGHLMGKKHMKNVEQANHRKKLEENSVFVSPIPPRTTPENITEFFRQFGPIQSCKFGNRYVIVQYTTKDPVDFLLNKPIYFDRWKLRIKRRVLDFAQQQKGSPKKSSEKQSTSDDNNDDELSERLKFKLELQAEPSWESQLAKFINTVQYDDATVLARCDKLCHSLNSVLEQSFPYGRAVTFGTTLTGLHLKHSDVDVFFDIGEEIHGEDQSRSEFRGNRNRKWTLKSIFREIKAQLYKNKSIFSQVVPIPCAKIPVIKFHHIPTETDCDITFKHGLGVHNSQLIKHYLTLDARLKPLMIIIKYWAKSLEISGTGKITNYSLVMAIIFYLQQPNVDLLPTVKELQASCEPIYNSGWLVNFDKNIKPDTSHNESSIPELVHGFFKFYNEFNFAENVICPLDGSILSKTDFIKNMTKLDINIDALNLSRPACIQDPFELDHNIAEGWTERLTQAFQKCCTEGVQLCELAAKDDYTSLLPSICDPILKHKSKTPSLIQFAIKAGSFETFGLSEEFKAQPDDDDKTKIIENNWFQIVYKLMEKIFTSMFKFELQIMYDGTTVKQMKVDENSDVHSESNDKIVLVCRGKYCLNRSRKSRVPLLDPTLSCIEKETLISDKIVAEMEGRKEQNAIKFLCCLQKKTSPLHILVTLTNEQHTNKSFMEIGSYMRSKIPSVIEKELCHMIQYKKEL